jgi:hypothetical protein
MFRCAEAKYKIYFDIFIHHKDIGVLIFSDFFDSVPLFTVTG